MIAIIRIDTQMKFGDKEAEFVEAKEEFVSVRSHGGLTTPADFIYIATAHAMYLRWAPLWLCP